MDLKPQKHGLNDDGYRVQMLTNRFLAGELWEPPSGSIADWMWSCTRGGDGPENPDASRRELFPCTWQPLFNLSWQRSPLSDSLCPQLLQWKLEQWQRHQQHHVRRSHRRTWRVCNGAAFQTDRLSIQRALRRLTHDTQLPLIQLQTGMRGRMCW